MTRINIYNPPGEDDPGGDRILLGWFDPDAAERFGQDTRWDGNNNNCVIGVITGSQWVDEYLYRTKGGRWVRCNDAHRYCNGPRTYEFVTDEEARDWLLRSECNDEAAERFFGEIEDEYGPGRPEIGGLVNVRLGPLVEQVDAYARLHGHVNGKGIINRAATIRDLLTRALAAAGVQS